MVEEPQPTHLAVLHHGWLSCAQWDFEDTGVVRALHDHGYEVLNCAESEGKDSNAGVAMCGSRCAQRVRQVVASLPSLTTITMVGFSFGGLVVRYAAAELYSCAGQGQGEARIAGLIPHTLMLCGTPNAGVQSTLNMAYKGFVRMFGGQTGKDLLLDTDSDSGEPLLLRMAQREEESSDNGEGGVYAEHRQCSGTCWQSAQRAEAQQANVPQLPFIAALAAFERRVLYANTLGDCICPYATAALVHYSYVHDEVPWYKRVVNDTTQRHDLGEAARWLAHHNDGAGVACDEITRVEIPGACAEEVYSTDSVPRRIVEALRDSLSWERYDLLVPPSQHNMVLGAHASAAIAAVTQHVASELCRGSIAGGSDGEIEPGILEIDEGGGKFATFKGAGHLDEGARDINLAEEKQEQQESAGVQHV